MSSFASYLEQRAGVVDHALRQLLPRAGEAAPRLDEAIDYSLFSRGKRLRPILLLAAGEAVGGSIDAALPFACAVEMIHTYSLIHDDLPAMDNDQLRRGQPTNHVRYGDALAILAGDGLLAEAFRVMGEAALDAADSVPGLRVIAEIAQASGVQGMVGGQVADLAAEGGEAGEGEIAAIHRRKTGALFRASVRSGAILAAATPAQLEMLTNFGECFGLAFQVTDDILDAVGNPGETGKHGGGDEQRGKRTFATAMRIDEARAHSQALCDQAVGALRELPETANPLRDLARFAVGRACELPPE